MRSLITPELFNNLAITFLPYKWKLLIWSGLFFLLFLLLREQVSTQTPIGLIWLTVFIIFSALQCLVFASFIFFFQSLPSTNENNQQWRSFYRLIEWCEAAIFSVLLPVPMLLFIYAFFTL